MRHVWLDVSIPLRPELTVWPGDPSLTLEPVSRITDGEGCNTSVVTLGTHSGTHIDAPWHFQSGGKQTHQVDSALFFGDALIVDYPGDGPITAAFLEPLELPERVLFKTRNSDIPLDGPFDQAYVAVAADGASCLVKKGVKLVGVDYLSVAPFDQEDQSTHHILLHHEVLIVEGLRLRNIQPGIHPFVVLPLPLFGADGAPCRAFVAQEAFHEP